MQPTLFFPALRRSRSATLSCGPELALAGRASLVPGRSCSALRGARLEAVRGFRLSRHMALKARERDISRSIISRASLRKDSGFTVSRSELGRRSQNRLSARSSTVHRHSQAQRTISGSAFSNVPQSQPPPTGRRCQFRPAQCHGGDTLSLPICAQLQGKCCNTYHLPGVLLTGASFQFIHWMSGEHGPLCSAFHQTTGRLPRKAAAACGQTRACSSTSCVTSR